MRGIELAFRPPQLNSKLWIAEPHKDFILFHHLAVVFQHLDALRRASGQRFLVSLTGCSVPLARMSKSVCQIRPSANKISTAAEIVTVFGSVAAQHDRLRFADGPPDRHQEQAVVVEGVGDGPGAVLIHQVQPRGEDVAGDFAFDLFDDQGPDDLALVRLLALR